MTRQAWLPWSRPWRGRGQDPDKEAQAQVGLGGGVIARYSEHPKEESAFIRKGFPGEEEVCKLGQKVR